MPDRLCIVCGAHFEGDYGQTKCPPCAAASRAAAVVRDRTCKQCGCTFSGGPRAWYCPDCRLERQREQDRQRKRKPASAVRKLGSTDHCTVCGQPYIVLAGRQRYCKACAPEAVREKDRAASREWNAANINYEQRTKDRHNAIPLRRCVVCGKEYRPNGGSLTCGAECAAAHKKQAHKQWQAEHREERNADQRNRLAAKLAAMTEEERREYRETQNARAREYYKRRKADEETK